MDYAFDFAISFSGRERDQARRLGDCLVARGARVFCDQFFRAHLLGKHLDDEFAWTFGAGTRFVVPIVSASYTQKMWPQYEWQVAKMEEARRDDEFILPLRVDDSILVGLSDNVCYLDLRNITLEDVSEILLQKLEISTVLTAGFDQTQDWVVTFGLSIYDLDEEDLPPNVPMEYALLCDWLTDDLLDLLLPTSLKNVQVVEDARSGETLRVRLSFEWNPSEGALDFGDMGWWQLLELTPYDDIYGTRDGE